MGAQPIARTLPLLKGQRIEVRGSVWQLHTHRDVTPLCSLCILSNSSSTWHTVGTQNSLLSERDAGQGVPCGCAVSAVQVCSPGGRVPVWVCLSVSVSLCRRVPMGPPCRIPGTRLRQWPCLFRKCSGGTSPGSTWVGDHLPGSPGAGWMQHLLRPVSGLGSGKAEKG